MKLVIFDLDGTLVDSLQDLAEATNHMRGQFGLPPLTAVRIRDFIGRGARELVRQALEEAPGADLDAGLSTFLTYNSDHIAAHTEPYPGVRETLTQLQAPGRVFAVASNKTEALCRKLLGVLELDGFFAAVMGADSHVEKKPLPGPLLFLMQRFGALPHETVMVGDSINDIAAGRAAGVVTVGCSFGYGDFREIADADYRVTAFHQIAELPPFRGGPAGS
ncbi:MAG TPA: HAD-IA family hydrolase [Verrucomicrobiae bacterium]|nr:HAD-IA family hydrolase [Verrucomicrobiae bacterium]